MAQQLLRIDRADVEGVGAQTTLREADLQLVDQ
jgi:hypothetical protein